MTVRFGLVGLGNHGRHAVAPALCHPDAHAELLAVCDVRTDALAAFDRPVAARFTDHRAMIREVDLDAVYVAAGMDFHHGIVVDCLEAGLHVVVEKPMADSLDKCRDMIAKAAAAGRVLAVNFETRYSEQNAILRRWIREGRFGRIEAMHFANLWDGHKRHGPVKERRARLMDLAGALDCGIHKLDQARFLMGGTWTVVEALGTWLDEPSRPPPHIGILGQLSTGVMITLNASLAWAATIDAKPMVNTLEIAGTDGVAICRSSPDFRRMTMELHSSSLSETHELDSAGHTADIVLLLNEFDAVVRNGWNAGTIMARGEDGYWAQFATDAANASAMRRRLPVA